MEFNEEVVYEYDPCKTDIKEPLEFDLSFEIFSLMYENLYNTVSAAISEEQQRMTEATPIPKEKMLENIIEFNLSKMEDECFITLAPDGKLHLCGTWLMRPFLVELPSGEKRMIPTMSLIQEMLKKNGKTDDVVFEPTKNGIDFRKEVWNQYPWKQNSFDLLTAVKIPDPTRNQISMMLQAVGNKNQAGGPPPGMVGMPPQGFAGGPPPGMSGMPPQGFAGGPPPNMGGMPPQGEASEAPIKFMGGPPIGLEPSESH